MLNNNELKIHFINVNHGDATIIEFPDYANKAHFGVVDFGAKTANERGFTRDYLEALVDLRRDNDANFNYVIEFVCVTHPHNDDYLTFIRVAAGSEFEFGETRITVLAPSIDLRNRFDTFGIGKNDASVVLKIKFDNSYIVLAADAEFASWGKSTEEFPRKQDITFFNDALALAERHETSDQLRCNLLKLSHHGSMHGTSLEYLERVLGTRNLQNRHIVVPAGNQAWYNNNVPSWAGYFPHPLVEQTIQTLGIPAGNIHITGDLAAAGNIIFKYDGGYSPRDIAFFPEEPGSNQFDAALSNQWH